MNTAVLLSLPSDFSEGPKRLIPFPIMQCRSLIAGCASKFERSLGGVMGFSSENNRGVQMETVDGASVIQRLLRSQH